MLTFLFALACIGIPLTLIAVLAYLSTRDGRLTFATTYTDEDHDVWLTKYDVCNDEDCSHIRNAVFASLAKRGEDE